MTWDLSTFRQAGIQTVLLFYGAAVFLGIAVQHMDSVAVGSEVTYVAILVGIAGMIIFANQVMGWTIPRPLFFILIGGASIYAQNTFTDTGFAFGKILFSALIVIAVLSVTWLVVDRFLAASNKRARARNQQKE